VGWDALFQTDENFARTYDIANKDDNDITNEIFLVGIGEKNYFDLRAQDFLVQSSGQISFDLNVASVSRDAPQITKFDSVAGSTADNERFTGISGDTTRASAELEWKATSISSGGLVSTASLSVLLNNDSIYRVMPAGAFEIRYPMIAQTETASHIFEPIAQIIARPSERNIGEFANEDAQSLVFDTTNLFERDKFSGYDRVEGGTRANIGFRYSASFIEGGNLDIVAGQSFHLGGDNSFAATNDLTNVGQESGLETDSSDIVASMRISDGAGVSAGVAIRLDEEDLDLNRSQVDLTVSQPTYSFRTSYTYTEAQPNYRFDQERHEITGSGSLRLDENWRVFGSASYDIESEEVFSHSIGWSFPRAPHNWWLRTRF